MDVTEVGGGRLAVLSRVLGMASAGAGGWEEPCCNLKDFLGRDEDAWYCPEEQ